jgi:stage 0 sporulation regulatory protein
MGMGEEDMKMKTIGKKSVSLLQINIKKREMYTKAKKFGMTHPSVVACSQELDTLLNRYQGIHQYNYVV